MDIEKKDEVLNSKTAADKFLISDINQPIFKAEAATVPNNMNFSRPKFNGTTERSIGHDNNELIKSRIAACREAYENVGIIGNIIDIMVDFALEGFTIVHESQLIQNFYINWANRVDLITLAEQVLKCIYRDANVPIIAFNAELKGEEISKFKKALSATNSKFLINDIDKNIIPYRYSVLDILKFDKIGSELLGTTTYTYEISAEDVGILKNPGSQYDKNAIKKLKDALGDEFDSIITTGRINIDPSRISMLYYKKDSYKKWANPMLWRIIDDVKFKKLLRDMDISAAEGVINALTIVKLGKTEAGLHASAEKFAKITDMLKNPAKSKTIVWDDLVSLETEYPPVDKILGSQKYEQVDDDIRSGLGIAEILVNGGGGNYSNSFLSVKTLLERLETGRSMFLRWLENEVDKIARNMGFRKPAWIKMKNMSLTDEEVEKRLLLELVDRNMVSYKTCIDRFGENFDIEIERMREEDQIREQGFESSPFTLLKTGKFGPQYQDGPINYFELIKNDTNIVDIAPTKQSPTGQENKGQLGGRPQGTKKKQRNRQVPKAPVGQKSKSSSIVIDYDFYKKAKEGFDLSYNLINNSINKDLSGDDRVDIIIEAIVPVLTNLENKDINGENINKVLSGDYKLVTAPAKLESCVKDVVRQKVKKFRERHNRSPDKEEMKDIVSSGYAICNASLKGKI